MKNNIIRKKTKEIRIKDIYIGGTNDILVQSMTNTDTLDSDSTIKQIIQLENCGCDIVRLTVPSLDSAKTITKIKKSGVKIPVVADIHFDYKIALEAIKCGADKIRINPGNIGEEWKIKEVVDACKSEGLPIRIGVNGGSLEKHILKKYSSPTPEALAESAFYHLNLLEKFGFYNSVISVKSSDVINMIEANKIISKSCDYPIHLGVTEAGDSYSGLVKSSIGIGSLLSLGIGDTIRVSLTENPVEEIKAGREILTSLGLYNNGSIQIISCPTCGRTKIDLINLSKNLKSCLENISNPFKRNIKVALMGCVVNGPGEAKECDIGVAGGNGEAVLFKKGQVITKIPEEKIIEILVKEISELLNNIEISQ